MTGKLMFVPDTHVVVPKEPTEDQLDAGEYWTDDAKWVYDDMLEKAPPLTTPPVLRWDGDYLKAGNLAIAVADESEGSFGWSCSMDGGCAKSLDEARRAAEKALGLPKV